MAEFTPAARVEERLRPAPDEWDGFRRTTAPTLVLAGGPTSHVVQRQLAELACRIPHARLATIPVARAVLDRLDLPEDSEDLAGLRSALESGPRP